MAKIGADTMLVDTGEGGRPSGGYVLGSMRLAGITPDVITLVVITHAHADQVLGLLSDDFTPVFPNATYVISSDEMAFWQGRIDNEVADHGPIVAMMRERGLRLIDMNEQILPGVTAVPTRGTHPARSRY